MCVGNVYKRTEECRQRLPSELIDLLATAISVNTGYTSRIVVSSLKNCVLHKLREIGVSTGADLGFYNGGCQINLKGAPEVEG